MAEVGETPGIWRVGFTKFATRMLGELVDAEWSTPTGGAVSPGQEIGYVEGFKAASDVFCALPGKFVSGNPALDIDACIVRSSPYVDGWLYAIEGNPPDDSLDVHEYIKLLDDTINAMQASGAYD